MVERIGIEKTKVAISEADLVIAIIDASKDLENEDLEILKLSKDKKTIVLLNKIDLGQKVSAKEITENVEKENIIPVSVLKNNGIEDLFRRISQIYNLNEIEIDDSVTVTNVRHKQAIKSMITNVEMAEKAVKERMPIDIITIYIMNILEEIGKITGEATSEDVINEIFKKFCLGK